jgi:hypothetical protein
MQAPITQAEQQIIIQACAMWGWQDICLTYAQDGLAAIGWFQVTKRTEVTEVPSIGKVRTRESTFWTLEKPVTVSGGPGEPDYDDLEEFDDIEGTVYQALEACRVEEIRWHIRADLERLPQT